MATCILVLKSAAHWPPLGLRTGARKPLGFSAALFHRAWPAWALEHLASEILTRNRNPGVTNVGSNHSRSKLLLSVR